MNLNPGMLGLFSITVLLLMVTPGVDMVFLLSSALAGGLRAGCVAMFAVASGALFQVACAALGLTSVVAAFPVLYKSIVVLGALYVAWIGLGLMRADSGLHDLEMRPRQTYLTLYRQGF